MAGNMINPQAQAQVEFFKSSVLPSVSYDGRGGVKDAVENFEALFIQDLLKVMRQSKPKEGGLFNSGNSKDIYTSMIDAELSKNLAKGRGLGLGQMLLKQLDNGGVSGEEKALQERSIRPLGVVPKVAPDLTIKPLGRESLVRGLDGSDNGKGSHLIGK